MHNGYYKVGKAEAISKSLYYDKNLVAIHNLLGDPEFEIWTNTPQEFSNIQVTRSDNRISVSGFNTNSNSAIVACYSNNGKLRKTTTSSDSIVFNGMSPNSTVMVYKHNYIPYIAPLLLQNVELGNSQYVIASDVIAGNTIDSSNRSPGDVTVKNGIEYEIEASGTVTLQDGFKVEKGATFAIYPSCF